MFCFVLEIHLLKKPGILSRSVPPSRFANCIPVVLLNLFLCPLHVLHIGLKRLNYSSDSFFWKEYFHLIFFHQEMHRVCLCDVIGADYHRPDPVFHSSLQNVNILILSFLLDILAGIHL